MNFKLKARLITLFCTFFFLSSNVVAQSVAELEKSVITATDDEKAAIYNQLAESTLPLNAAKSIEYAMQALKFSRATNDPNEEGIANINLGQANKVLGKNASAISNFGDAAQVFQKSKDDYNTAVALSKLTEMYVKENKLSEAIATIKTNTGIYSKLNDKKGIASCNSFLGDIQFKQSQYKEAIESYTKAQNFYLASNDAKNQIKLYSRIGNAYSNFGDFLNAKANMEKALSIAKKNNLSTEVQFLNKSIEVIDKNASNYTKSQTNFAKEEKVNLEQKTSRLEQQNNLSLAQIEELSLENQIKAYKLKAQQDQLDKAKIEAEIKAKQIQLLKKDTELKELSIQKQKQVILFTSFALILLALLTIIITWAYSTTKKQKRIIEIQKKQVEEKQSQIISALNAASLIQDNMLPKKDYFSKLFPQHFIYYQPKDIVSGDFYWVKELEDAILLAVADCTGHGVPGAFMSLHGYNMLEKIVQERKITNPVDILNELNAEVVKSMAGPDDEAYVKNGMDIALIKLNKTNNSIQFSGAKNNLLISRKNELIELKSDRMSIGHIFEKKFTEKQIQLESSDIIYLSTDGFKDQKNKTNTASLTSKGFNEYILNASQKRIGEQHNYLNHEFTIWSGNTDQTDDICVIGIKVI